MKSSLTAVGMGSSVRHMVLYWEGEYVGWKLWYPTDIDGYVKRTPQLMAIHMIGNNLGGCIVFHDMGNDIMFVQNTPVLTRQFRDNNRRRDEKGSDLRKYHRFGPERG